MTPAKIGIYTGADHVAFHYCGGMLLSLKIANDLALPVTFIDFGLSEDQRRAIEASGLVSEVIDIYPLISDSIRGLERRARERNAPKAIHLARTMRKLGIFKDNRYDQFLWCDIDTLWFGKVSEVVSVVPDGKIRAGRVKRQDYIASHVADIDGSNAQVAQEIGRLLCIKEPFSSFNSGVFQVSRNTATQLMDGSDEFIRDYGLSLFGDQAFINLVGAAQGWEILPFGETVNFAVTADPHGRASLIPRQWLPADVL